jgi:hypothetical protein
MMVAMASLLASAHVGTTVLSGIRHYGTACSRAPVADLVEPDLKEHVIDTIEGEK